MEKEEDNHNAAVFVGMPAAMGGAQKVGFARSGFCKILYFFQENACFFFFYRF